MSPPADQYLKVASPPYGLADVLLGPAGWTRLEPQSVSGDPAPGAEARTADPLWMVGRQWQFGELEGEDVATPVVLRVKVHHLPVTAWAPRGDSDAPVGSLPWRPLPPAVVLDELVEHVPRDAVSRGLRRRAETGAQLVDVLRERGETGTAGAVVAAYPLELPDDPADPAGDLDPAAQRLHDVLAGAVPDGLAVLDDVAGGEPPWVGDADDPDTVREVLTEWAAWAGGRPDAGGAWTTRRLEHRFALRCGSGDSQRVLLADAFPGGPLRWHHVRWAEGVQVTVDGDADLSPPVEQELVTLASPLRYPGMPADRYWQCEDSSVDVAAMQAQPHDLARLCLAEFAMTTGDDWLVVPVDAPAGSLCQVLGVEMTTTFGEVVTIDDVSDVRRRQGFTAFEIDGTDGGWLDGVLLPPVAATPLEGAAVEEVLFLRDEGANLVWAVERTVPGRSGDPRSRGDEPPPAPEPDPDGVRPGDLVYRLATTVPRHWIPFLPVSAGYARVRLRKGAVERDGAPILPVGTLLAPTPLDLPAEEVPREGVQVRAVPMLARRADGSYARWTAHRQRVGRGEGRSGWENDSALPPG